MTIRITPRQYKTLIKMAWIASRVAQGSELQESETVSGILELADVLCNMAEDFGEGDLFQPVNPDGEDIDGKNIEQKNVATKNKEQQQEFSVGGPPPVSVRLKADIEDELMSIIEWFEEYSFWEILEDRLAMRDISEERTEAQWNWLPDTEKDRIYNKYVEYYFEEFAQSGVSTLRLIQPEPGKPTIPLGWGDGTEPTMARNAENEKRHTPAKIIEFPGPNRPQNPNGTKPPKKPRG